MALKVLEMLSN